MPRYNKTYFTKNLKENISIINQLYNEVIVSELTDYNSFADFDSSIEMLVKTYVDYHDYLHSNNLIQFYKDTCKANKKGVSPWYNYYSIKLLSLRVPLYFLKTPSALWDVVFDLLDEVDYIEKINNLLYLIIKNYQDLYIMQPQTFTAPLKEFVNYYVQHGTFSELVSGYVVELFRLLNSSDSEIKDIVRELPSNKILEKDDATTEEIEQIYGDVQLNECSKKIVIMGDDKFLNNTNLIFGIAKQYNINKNQLEIYNNYVKIKSIAKGILNKIQYNDKYIGIIFGPVPHKVSGIDNFSSIIAKCKQEEGFPVTVDCRDNSQSNKLKVTKTSFKQALIKIIKDYLAR